MANINNELAMTNQSKGGILMASKSKLAQKTKATSNADDPTGKKPTSSKGDAGSGRRAELRDHERAVGRPSHMPATDIRCSRHRIMGRTSRILKW
jgi:hypothetical protein